MFTYLAYIAQQAMMERPKMQRMTTGAQSGSSVNARPVYKEKNQLLHGWNLQDVARKKQKFPHTVKNQTCLPHMLRFNPGSSMQMRSAAARVCLLSKINSLPVYVSHVHVYILSVPPLLGKTCLSHVMQAIRNPVYTKQMTFQLQGCFFHNDTCQVAFNVGTQITSSSKNLSLGPKL